MRRGVAELGRALGPVKGYRVVVVKSTVVPGTTQGVVEPLLRRSSGKSARDLGVVFNPEFLSEGRMVHDTLHPQRIVLGASDPQAVRWLVGLYRRFDAPVFELSPSAAELVKYASNAFLALKVSFANEIGRLTERLDGNVDRVMDAVGADPRIGTEFLRAGPGFGGSCFRKDLRAMVARADELGVRFRSGENALAINSDQMVHAIDLVRRTAGTLRNRTVTVLGVAFKAGTDDVRESRALPLVKALLQGGARVRLHDPEALVELPTGAGPRLGQVVPRLVLPFGRGCAEGSRPGGPPDRLAPVPAVAGALDATGCARQPWSTFAERSPARSGPGRVFGWWRWAYRRIDLRARALNRPRDGRNDESPQDPSPDVRLRRVRSPRSGAWPEGGRHAPVPVALVTGAGRGLGRAVTRALVGRKYCVVTCSTSSAAPGLGEALHRRVDVSDPAAVDAFMDEMVARFGRLDVLVNNAGYANAPTPISGTSEEVARRCFGTNVLGPFSLMRRALPVMLAQPEGGVVVNIASRAALAPVPGLAAYSASKTALVSLTLAAAKEVDETRVLVRLRLSGRHGHRDAGGPLRRRGLVPPAEPGHGGGAGRGPCGHARAERHSGPLRVGGPRLEGLRRDRPRVAGERAGPP